MKHVKRGLLILIVVIVLDVIGCYYLIHNPSSDETLAILFIVINVGGQGLFERENLLNKWELDDQRYEDAKKKYKNKKITKK